ncbi:MAG TPA: vanadium-dependent haloperoxidase [Chloroflexota bacterium]|nr:vanadium-dependent haloperoxidase [Chloroflexota bacterium]
MTYKTDRRAALKLLTAAPLGLALSAALAHEAVAQTPRGAFGANAVAGPSSSEHELRGVVAQPAADANVINDWNATAVNVIVTDAATPPAEAAPYLGFVQAAVYNAVVGITRRYALYKSNAQPGPMASPQAAAAAAAHRVLMTYYGHVPAAVTRLTDAYATSIGAGPYDPSTTQGIQYGRQAAERIIALRAEDGRYGPNTFEMAAAPGIWRPTAPANAPFFAKFLCETTPLMIESPSQFRPGPPPDLTSAQYAAEFEEVKAFGSKEGSARTPLQTETALFAASIVPGPLHAALRDLAVRREMDISDRARLFAAVDMSIADTTITVWDSKVHYGIWRPIHAIRLADEDGNPATAADPTFEPLIPNPPYPDYTSGFNGVIGSLTRALTRVLGTDRIDLTISSPVTTRYYEFADPLCADAVDARVWAGIHFRFADVASMAQGQQVADWAMDRYFKLA